VKWYYFISFV